MLDIRERNILVVGGGKIAARKIKALLLEGANITVISDEISEEINDLFREYENHLNLIKEKYSKENISDNYLLVLAATNNSNVNREISEICKKRNILCNIVDNKELSDVAFMSVVRRGDLTIGVSTNGQSPSLTIKIKKEIEALYGEEYEEYISLLGAIRNKIINNELYQKSKKNILNELINKSIEELRETLISL